MAIGWAILFGFVSFLPTYYLPPFLVLVVGGVEFAASKYLSLILMVAMGVAACSTASFRRRGWWQLCRPSFSVLVWMNLAVGVLSLIKAQFVVVGTLKWFYYAATGPAAFLFVRSMSLTECVKLIRLMVVVGALVALYGIVEYVYAVNYLFADSFRDYNPYYEGPSRIASSIGNPVALGCYLVILSPLAWYVYLHDRKMIPHGLSVAIISIAIVFTYSRSAWVAVGIAAFVYAHRRARVIQGWVSQRLTQGILVALCVLLLLPIGEIVGGRQTESVTARVLDAVARIAHATETERFRLSQYMTAVNVLRQEPLLGVGIGNFTRLYDVYAASDAPQSNVRTTDNMYLMVACERGILGVTLFLTFITAAWWFLWISYQSTVVAHKKDLILAILASTSAMIVSMLFWDAMNFTATRILFWIVIGFGVVASTDEEPDARKHKKSLSTTTASGRLV
jgi:O-antigen ligase